MALGAPAPPAGRDEVLVRAGLAGVAVALLGGWVTTQYVGVHLMSLLSPMLVGVAASWATAAAAGRGRGRLRGQVLAEAVAAALIGTALGFTFTPGGQSPLHPLGEVGPPYLAALLGVALWPLVFATPAAARPGRGGVGEGDCSGQGVEGTD